MNILNCDFRTPSLGILRGCISAAGFLLILGLMTAPVRATTIANLTSPPTATTAFMFGGSPIPQFQVGPGPTNGEGNFTIQVPYDLAGPGASYDPGSGITTFSNAYLVLIGLTATSPATSGFGEDFQNVGPGSFALYAADDSTLLLGGSFGAGSEIFGPDGTTTAFTFSGAATYDSGSIWTAASPLSTPLYGTVSSNLILTNHSEFSLGPTYLNPFTAEGQELFNAMTFNIVPEPASFALLACGLVGLAGWGAARRRTK